MENLLCYAGALVCCLALSLSFYCVCRRALFRKRARSDGPSCEPAAKRQQIDPANEVMSESGAPSPRASDC